MGSSVSKTRSLKKSAETINETLLKQNRGPTYFKNAQKVNGENELKATVRRFGKEDRSGSEDNHQIYTKRPKEDLGEGLRLPDKAGDKPLLEKAIDMGVVNIKETTEQFKMDPNHTSVKVLKNREKVEKEYEGLFKPKHSDEPDTPERFLSEEQKKAVIEKLKPENLNRKGKNVYGLLDSRKVSDLIIDYKVHGDEKVNDVARDLEVNTDNISILKHLIDSNIINLPTNKVILDEVKDQRTKQIRQQLKIVKDDWVNEVRSEFNVQKDQKGNSAVSKDEVKDQIKILEDLVSKSQISTKKSDHFEGTEETVYNRPKKVLVKEVTRNL